MPIIRLITNLGTADAIRLGLLDSPFDGDVAEVSDAIAEEAIRRGWAVLADGDAVPPEEPAEEPEDDAEPEEPGEDDDEDDDAATGPAPTPGHPRPGRRHRHRQR